MKTRFVTVAFGILTVGSMSAEPLGKISFGVPHRKSFPATEGIPSAVYIELPITITNTSTEAFRFGTNLGPQFTEYVRRKITSNHWSNITPKGMCGVGFSVSELAPGASLDSTMLIQMEYAGHGFRVELPIIQDDSHRGASAKLKSPAIVIPKIQA